MNKRQLHTGSLLSAFGTIRMKMLAALGCCLLLSLSLGAQTRDKWLAKGLAAYEDHEYGKAIDYLEWSVAHGGGWESKLALAKCWGAQMNYAQARAWYAQIIDEPGIPITTYFQYGQSLMAAKKYEEAEKWFSKYALLAPNDPNAAIFRHLDQLVNAVQGDSMLFVVERLRINSRFSDFSPCFYRNGLLFVSGRPNDLGVHHVSTVDDAELLDVYFSAPDSNGRWSHPKPMSSLNTKFNEGPMSIDAASGTLYMTRNDLDHRTSTEKSVRKGLNRLRIEEMPVLNDAWEAARSLPFNNKAYAVGHPTLTADGKTMYFASDIPGGLGGTDIYISQQTENGWNTPVNLGMPINTTGDEMFPFLDAEGMLYFASDGHLGLGGLDMFAVQRLGNGAWGQVQNLGYPLNSERDDFGIITDQDGNHGYFSSNRGNAPENDDIFVFSRDWPRFECAPMQENQYCFIFTDDAILDIDTLPFVYEWSFGDGFKARGLEPIHCFEGPGDYNVELKIIDTLVGKVAINRNGYVHSVRDIEQVVIDAPDTIVQGQDFTLSAQKSMVDGCNLERYYWDLGNGIKARGPEVQHHYDVLGAQTVRLGVTGRPMENGDLVCKNCVTKEVVVVSQAKMDSVEAGRASRKAQWQILRDTPLPEFKPRKIVAANGIGPRKPGSVDTRIDLPIDSRPSDTLIDGLNQQVPSFKDFPSGDPQKLQQQPIANPVMLIADFVDATGMPLQATFSLAAIGENSTAVRIGADLQGSLKMELVPKKLYLWTALAKGHLPVTGMIDLTVAPKQIVGADSVYEHVVMKALFSDLETGDLIRLNNIYFDFDSDNLRPESHQQIHYLARLLAEHPEIGVAVQAHTDNIGSDIYNLDLSKRRAYSVLRYMILSGYDLSHITSMGFGESVPAVPNDSPEHRQYNRRVEFKLLPYTN